MIDVSALIKTISVPSIIIFLLYFIIKNPEKIQIWVSILQRLYAWASKDSQKKVIANEIEGKLNLYSRKINEELGTQEIMPYIARIEWVDNKEKEIDRDAFIKEDHIIIKMTYHQNREKNLALSALDYVSRGLIPRGRVFVSKKIMKSIDLKMAQKILTMSSSHSGLEYFIDDILPLWLKDPDIEGFYEKMQPIEERGFLIVILLNEILILGKTIPLDDERRRQRAIAETRNLILFLHDIATKGKEEVKLDFVKKEIMIGIILIAREELKQALGEKPYLKRFKMNIEAGCRRVYILARDQNIPFAQQVVKELEQKEQNAQKLVEKEIKVTTQKGKVVKGYFSLFKIEH